MKKNQWPEGMLIACVCSKFPDNVCIGMITVPPQQSLRYVRIAEDVLVPLSGVITHEATEKLKLLPHENTNEIKEQKIAETIAFLQEEHVIPISGLSALKKFGAGKKEGKPSMLSVPHEEMVA